MIALCSNRFTLLTNQQSVAKYCRGETVVIKKNRDPKGRPPGTRFWIWEAKYDPSYSKSTTRHEREKIMSYLLKDGPGEDAKDVGWATEASLEDWLPPTQEQ